MRYTGSRRIGPVRLHFGTRGLTSASVRVGPVTYRLWSRRGDTGVSSVDLPGPWSYRLSWPRRR